MLPYATTRADYAPLEQVGGAGFANPFRSRANYLADAGMDVKYRLASNLTLDATVNAVAQQLAQDCGKVDPIVRMAQRDGVMMVARVGMLGLLAAAGTTAAQMGWLGACLSLMLGLSVFALARPAKELSAA